MMKLYGAHYCDFVVWKKNDMFIQRIICDLTFITDTLNKIPPFITLCILPELIVKWFTRPAEPSVDPVYGGASEVAWESLEGPSDMMTLHSTEVNVMTVASDMLTSTQHILQVLEDSDHSEDDTLWWYCQQSMQEELVGCDNPNSKIKWFYLSCLQLMVSQLPKSKWCCPKCHKERHQSKCKGKGKKK